MKKLHFLTGLPRAGSTLLGDLLAQNPDFYASPSSGVRDMTNLIKNNWNGNEHFQASFDIEGVNAMIKGVAHNYYSTRKEPVIFDKNRGWTSELPLATLLSNDIPKMLVCVRDLTDILASFEKMYRSNNHNFMISLEKGSQEKYETLEGRCEVWAATIIGKPFQALLESKKMGYMKHYHIVEFDNLTSNPEDTLKGVYEYLGKKWDAKLHQYDNVEMTTHENEIVRGFPQSLHEIRPKVEHFKSGAMQILGKELFDKYSNQEFWRS